MEVTTATKVSHNHTSHFIGNTESWERICLKR